MTTFSPNGRGHICLIAVERGPVSFADMCAANGAVGQGKQRRKLFLALVALRNAAFVRREGPETYAATAAGLEALDRLRAGLDVSVEPATPNARVFVQREAA